MPTPVIVLAVLAVSARDLGRSAAAATLATVGLLALAGRLHERREL